MISSLRSYLQFVREKDLLLVIHEEVQKEDLPELIEILSRKGKVLLFEKISGYNLKVVSNLVPSLNVFSLLFGTYDPYSRFVDLSKGKIERKLVEPEELLSMSVSPETDLTEILPILWHYELDSAPYITSAVVSSIDPETGFVGRGIHRMEFRGKNKLGISLLNPPLSEIFEKYRKLKKEMPVSISIGLDPLTFLAMALRVPHGVDKIEVAGSLKGEAIEVMRSFDSEIDVPKGSEFLLEGTIDPYDLRKDGPLGEISGYYLTLDQTPTVTIKRLSHRKDPIYHALLPTSTEANMYLEFVSKAQMELYLRQLYPFVAGVNFVTGTFGSSVIISVEQTERPKINNLLHFVLSLPMVKKAIVVEKDVDPKDLRDVEWAQITRCFASDDIMILPHMQGQPIDPEWKTNKGVTKVGINATSFGKPLEGRARIRKGKKERVEPLIERYLQ